MRLRLFLVTVTAVIFFPTAVGATDKTLATHPKLALYNHHGHLATTNSLMMISTNGLNVQVAVDSTIAKYVATRKPLDRAGVYGIRGHGALSDAAISGRYFDVMDLPLARLHPLFREFEGLILGERGAEEGSADV